MEDFIEKYNVLPLILDFQKQAPNMIKVRPRLDSLPPRLGFEVNPDAPPQIKKTVKELELAIQDVQSLTTEPPAAGRPWLQSRCSKRGAYAPRGCVERRYEPG